MINITESDVIGDVSINNHHMSKPERKKMRPQDSCNLNKQLVS